MNDLLRLKSRGYASRALDMSFSPDDPFRFVEDETVREVLMNSGHFQLIEADRLTAALGGDTGDVVEVIDSGGSDEILDFLLYAERQHEGRASVLNAIADRSRTLEADEEDEDNSVVPAVNVTTSR